MKIRILFYLLILNQYLAINILSHQPICFKYFPLGAQYLKGTTCETIPDCFIAYDDNSNRCRVCNIQKFAVENFKCIPAAKKNCQQYEEISDECSKCNKGYYLTPDGFCKQTENCNYGKNRSKPSNRDDIMNLPFIAGIRVLANNLDLDEIDNYCFICDENTYTNYNFQCVKEQRACLEKAQDGSCQKCIPFFEKNSLGICIHQNCEEQNKNTESIISCEKDRCKKGYSQLHESAKIRNMRLEEEMTICLKVNDNCYISHPTLDFCLICNFGFDITDKFQCVASSTCKSFEDNLCKECIKGYHFNEKSLSCIRESCQVFQFGYCICDSNRFQVKLNQNHPLSEELNNFGCVVLNCRKYDKNLECIECFENFQLNQFNRCDSSSSTPIGICSDNQYEDDLGNCVDLPNCKIASQQHKRECIKCDDDQNLKFDFFYKDSSNQCVLHDHFCTVFDSADQRKCLQENELYLVNSNRDLDKCDQKLLFLCYKCQDGYQIDQISFTCLKIPNCIKFDKNDDCIKCANGYQLQDNKCVLVCDNCANSKFCVKNLNNDPSQKCLQCHIGHYLDQKSGLCMRIPFCLDYKPDEQTGLIQCIKCSIYFTLLKGQCVIQFMGFYGLYGFIDNCFVHMKVGSQFICLICKEDYDLDKQFRCIKAKYCEVYAEDSYKCIKPKANCYLDDFGVAGLVNDCKVFDETQKRCTECRQGGALDYESGLCYKIIEGCKQYEDTYLKCKKCDELQYFLTPSRICKKIVFCQKVNLQTLTCDVCEPQTYKYQSLCFQDQPKNVFCDSNYECNKCTNELCDKCEQDLNSCISCIIGYNILQKQCHLQPVYTCPTNCQICSQNYCQECKKKYLIDNGKCEEYELSYNSSISDEKKESVKEGCEKVQDFNLGVSIGLSVLEVVSGPSFSMNMNMLTSQKISLLILMNMSLPPLISELLVKISENHPSKKFQMINLLKLDHWKSNPEIKMFKDSKFQQQNFYYNILMTSGSAITLFGICLSLKLLFNYLQKTKYSEKVLKIYDSVVIGQIFTFTWISIQILWVGFAVQILEFIVEGEKTQDIAYKLIMLIIIALLISFNLNMFYKILNSQPYNYASNHSNIQQRDALKIEFFNLTCDLIQQSKQRRFYLFFYFSYEMIIFPSVSIYLSYSPITCSMILLICQIIELIITVHLRPFTNIISNIHFIVEQSLWICIFFIWMILSILYSENVQNVEQIGNHLDSISWAFVIFYFLVTFVSPIFLIIKIGKKLIDIIKEKISNKSTKIDENLILNSQQNLILNSQQNLSMNNIDQFTNQMNFELTKKTNYINFQPLPEKIFSEDGSPVK